MATLLASTYRRSAHDRHRCGHCGGFIPWGDRYLDQRLAGDGHVWTFRAHSACDAIYWRLHRELGLCDDDIVSPAEIRDSIRAIFERMV